MTKQANIASQISSRICHDLTNPIGAISNGLELLTLSGAPLSPELSLISESVGAANAKLQFLRIAFGENHSDSTLAAPTIKNILHNYYAAPHMQVVWNINTATSQNDLQLLFLILLCVEKLAPYGGQVTLTQKATSHVVTIIGDNLKTSSFGNLTTHRFLPQDGPALIQFNLAQNQIDQMGYTMILSEAPGKLHITITP